MNKTMRSLIVALGLGAAGAGWASGPILVSEPGSDGFNIETMVFNGSSFDLMRLSFDFTHTLTSDGGHLVIDGSPLSLTSPSGGSATFFGGGSVFGFDFTGFNTFDTFKFKWDPDSSLSGAYGATGIDFVGARVTADTSAGVYAGNFGRVGDTADVSAVLSPVPEPAAYLLALAGVLMLVAQRRSGRR